MIRDKKIKTEEKFPISGQGDSNGKLLDNTASKSYMSKPYYIQSKSLHTIPKFASTMQRV